MDCRRLFQTLDHLTKKTAHRRRILSVHNSILSYFSRNDCSYPQHYSISTLLLLEKVGKALVDVFTPHKSRSQRLLVASAYCNRQV